MQHWIANGCKRGELPNPIGDIYARVLLVKAEGEALIYANNEHPIRILMRYSAIGSGQDYAITAMHLGKSSIEAVAIASELCAGCGLGIDTLEL